MGAFGDSIEASQPASLATMPHAQTPSRRSAHQRAALSIAALAGALMLQACGGGGGGSGTPSNDAPTVTGVSVDRLKYSQLSTFTITGTNLTSASFAATGCDTVTTIAGGSATQQQITCTPNGALSVVISATTAGGNFYTRAAQVVPKPQVTLTTSLGTIVLELDPTKAPITVKNYMAYVNSGFYNGTIFHRVIAGFMNQGGGFTGVSGSTLTPKTGVQSPIALEINKGLSNLRGTIAMASLSTPNSATSQFFINAVDNTFLDQPVVSLTNPSPGYAVFGAVVSGLSVVDAINAVATKTVGTGLNPYDHVPMTDVVLTTATQTQ
jgi:peptidyl-prolyl cis-trans isomerase A (cyclophilin A)